MMNELSTISTVLSENFPAMKGILGDACRGAQNIIQLHVINYSKNLIGNWNEITHFNCFTHSSLLYIYCYTCIYIYINIYV